MEKMLDDWKIKQIKKEKGLHREPWKRGIMIWSIKRTPFSQTIWNEIFNLLINFECQKISFHGRSVVLVWETSKYFHGGRIMKLKIKNLSCFCCFILLFLFVFCSLFRLLTMTLVKRIQHVTCWILHIRPSVLCFSTCILLFSIFLGLFDLFSNNFK